MYKKLPSVRNRTIGPSFIKPVLILLVIIFCALAIYNFPSQKTPHYKPQNNEDEFNIQEYKPPENMKQYKPQIVADGHIIQHESEEEATAEGGEGEEQGYTQTSLFDFGLPDKKEEYNYVTEYQDGPRIYQNEIRNNSTAVFIFGLGGSGTRAVTKLFKTWNCTVDFVKLNFALDNSLFFGMNRVFYNIIRRTRTGDFNYDEIDQSVRSYIENRFLKKFEIIQTFLRNNTCVVVKWPRMIYFLPVLRHHFPNSKFVHVVRDGRDMILSENRNQFRDMSRLYIYDPSRIYPVEYHILRFWYLVNVEAKHYLQRECQGDYTLLNTESLVLKKDEEKYRELWFHAHGTVPPPNLADNSVFVDPIGNNFSTKYYGKFKYVTSQEQKQLVQNIQLSYKTELEEFGYDVDLWSLYN